MEFDLAKVNDDFANKEFDIKVLWQKLIDVAEKLEANPFYTYPLKKFINEVEKCSQEKNWPMSAICGRLYNLLSGVWFPISSAASAIIPLDEQKKLILHISSLLKKLYEVVPDNAERFLTFDKAVYSISRNLKEHLKTIKKTSLPLLRRRRFKPIIKEGWPQWKKDLITLIGIWGLFEKRNQPEYILKSGLRSFYFFDLSRALYDPRIREDFVHLVQEGVESFLQKLEEEGIETNDILFIDKTYGEGPGTVVLSSLLLKQRYADIQALPSTPWFDRIRGLSLEEKQVYRPVFIDTLTTTGGTLREILERLDEMRCQPTAYLVLIDRSLKGIQHIKGAEKLRIFSLISFNDLVDAGILKPEILLGDIENPIHFALDLKRDSIYEICKFYHKEQMYEEFRERFYELVDRAFNVKENKIYGKIEILGEIEAFKNAVINILILSYNSLKKHLKFISQFNGIKYIKYIYETERYRYPVLCGMSKLLKNRLKGNSVKVDDIIDVFAINYLDISRYVFEQIHKYQRLIPKEKYSRADLEKLAQMGVKKLEEVYKKALDLPSFTFTNKEARAHFIRLRKIYKSFNEIFGKPHTENFLGEKFWEESITSPKCTERK